MNKKATFSLIFYIQFHLWYFVIHFKELLSAEIHLVKKQANSNDKGFLLRVI